VVNLLGLPHPLPTLFIAGGAMHMEDAEMELTRPMIEDGLARFAQENRVAIIDGGTESGVMQLMGDARRKRGYDFPLIGVAPYSKVSYLGHQPPDGKPLNSGHSHFVLVEGDKFGDESPMIADLTRALTDNGKRLGMGIIINGGKVTREETYERVARSGSQFPMIVLEGSGRFADTLATAKHTGSTDDPQVRTIVEQGDLHFLRLDEGADALRRILHSCFKITK
jgi:hypothetical protein